jgi:hypothetical protein
MPRVGHRREDGLAREGDPVHADKPAGVEGGMTSVDTSVTREYVEYLRDKLIEAEGGLRQMSQNYDAAKAHFDDLCFRQGITPETDMVSYQDRKKLHPELVFWNSKVEHFQREVAAYGAALTGIEAAGRMLALPSHPVPVE